MALIEVTATGPLSYKTLKDYHETAQGIYNIRVLTGENIEEEEHEYTILIEAENPFGARVKFENYISKLNDLGVFYHHAHLNYLVKNIIEFEGNYSNEEAVLNKAVSGHVQLLKKLLMLLDDDFSKVNLEYSHKNFSNKDYTLYTVINDPDILRVTLKAAIDQQFNAIKSNQHIYSYQFNEALATMAILDVDTVNQLASITKPISPSHFRTQLLYTICYSILSYLNTASSLNPNKVFATNDQLRVIWATCKLHGLLDVDYEGYNPSEINYIRSILTNKSHPETLLGVAGDLDN